MSTTRSGGCHCGAVRFEATGDFDKVIECNCSHCEAKGLLLAFLPQDALSLLSGEDSLTEYRFNTHKLSHQFCKRCGVQSFARGEAPTGARMAAINVRSIDNIDLGALTISKVDGKSF
jgi:hypothetical protein